MNFGAEKRSDLHDPLSLVFRTALERKSTRSATRFARYEREAASRTSFTQQIPVIQDVAVNSERRIWAARAGRGGAGGRADVASSGEYMDTSAAAGIRIPAAFGPGG